MSSGVGSPNISIVPGSPKPYDYLLKFLLVGDSDVGKEELLGGMEDGATESPYGFSSCGNMIIHWPPQPVHGVDPPFAGCNKSITHVSFECQNCS